jgi:hypothetical protein
MIENNIENSSSKGILNSKEASLYIKSHGGIASESLLAKLRLTGGGPIFHKFGNKRIIYKTEDLDNWISSRLSKALESTSTNNY